MLTPDLLVRHARPGPRYTSYPTVPVWQDAPPDSLLLDAVGALDGPVSVYVHVPFCREQCTFCGCNMVVARRQDVGDRFLDAIAAQLDSFPLPDQPLPLVRLHLGGGTPTWLTPTQLERLFGLLFARFTPADGAELGVEADPDVTTDAHLQTLADLGVTRISLGVQSLDPVVLHGVNRPQHTERIEELVTRARTLGMRGLNLDLMYGLPHQTMDRFVGTVRRILQMTPDRLALFGYAHVPWLKRHQRALDESALPGPVDRAALFLAAQELLEEAGYVPIGLDHFARADDALAVALGQGTLRRDFMGYTDRPHAPMIGLGPSSISELPKTAAGPARFAQQKSKLAAWWRSVEKGEPLLERGILLTDEDRLRSDLIEELMCNLALDLDALGARYGLDLREHLKDELHALQPMAEEGLIQWSDAGFRVPDSHRLLVRNVAMVFDAYLKKPAPEGPRFSQTV